MIMMFYYEKQKDPNVNQNYQYPVQHDTMVLNTDLYFNQEKMVYVVRMRDAIIEQNGPVPNVRFIYVYRVCKNVFPGG